MAQRFYVQDLTLTSPAFDHHRGIPDRHTTNGENVSPPLEWRACPVAALPYGCRYLVVPGSDEPYSTGAYPNLDVLPDGTPLLVLNHDRADGDVVPNLHLFYPSGAIVGAEEVSVHRQFVGADYMLTATAYGVAYSVVVLVLAMVIFRRRDFV